MKNKFRFEFHPFYYLVAFICIVTGHFKDFIWISILIMVHELGHVSGSIWRHFKISKVIIFPFGGMTILKDSLNRLIVDEWIVLLLGPLYQECFFLLLTKLFGVNPIFATYHYVLLFFNLLPIIPLDGSKLIELILGKCCSYWRAKKITFFCSVVCLIFLSYGCLLYFNLMGICIVFFLGIHQIRYYKEMPYVFSKFLWERMNYSFSFKKVKKIKECDFKQMKRDYNHVFLLHHHWYSEREVLKSHFCSKF